MAAVQGGYEYGTGAGELNVAELARLAELVDTRDRVPGAAFEN